MKNTLITGGAGFIATHLIESLFEDSNNRIVAVDNLSMCDDKNIRRFFNKPNFVFRQVELNDAIELAKIFTEFAFHRVYHLAANSDISLSFTNPQIDYLHTFNTTWNVLEAMRVHGVKELIFASSSAIFGEVGDHFINESFGPILPISHYGAGKLASEAFISSYAHNYAIQSLIVRFPNVIGEYATHGVIYDFVKKLKVNSKELVVLGDGKQEKSYLYVKDLITAIQFAWDKKVDQVDIFNIGGMDTICVSDIAKIVVKQVDLGSSISFTGGNRGWKGDVPKFAYQIEKILRTGWRPQFNSTEAVERTVRAIIKELW
jgi:UDP-glucose 4-epimerase